MTATADAPGMSALVKASRVLEAFADTGELTAAEIAEKMGESLSAVYRLLRKLEAIDWVEPSEEWGRFRLGVGVVRLGRAVEDTLDPRQLALPQMRALLEEVGETVSFLVPRGRHGTCIERLDALVVRATDIHLGASLPLHRGAGPRTMLAFSDPDLVAGYVDSLSASPDNPLLASDRVALLERLETIRVSYTDAAVDEIVPGVTSVAAPVLDHRGEAVGSLMVSALTARVARDLESVEGAVRAHADAVSSQLGGAFGSVSPERTGARG